MNYWELAESLYFYYMRWKHYFDNLSLKMEGEKPEEIDFYALEEPWTKATNPYSFKPEGDCIPTVKRIFKEIFPHTCR